MEKVKCPICEFSIHLIPDGIIRSCKCTLLWVDHTNTYTRYIGLDPGELIMEIRKKLNLM